VIFFGHEIIGRTFVELSEYQGCLQVCMMCAVRKEKENRKGFYAPKSHLLKASWALGLNA
jgi:hypothetical protein